MSADELRGRARPWLVAGAILALFLVLRWPLLHFPPFGDEDLLIRDAADLGRSGLTGYPILALAIVHIGLEVVGLDGLRWVPFLFSLGVLGLTALLAGRLLGRRGAAWAALILALEPLSVSVSAQLLFDGAFVAFFALASACAYLKAVERDSIDWRWAAAFGAMTGCLAMTSYAVVVLTAGLALHCWLTRGIKTTLKLFAAATVAAAAVFSIYPLLYPEHYRLAAQKPAATLPSALAHRLSMPASLYARALSKALFFVGPLPVWAVCLALARRDLRARLALPLCAALAYAALVFLLVNPDRTVGYWAAVLPFVCVAAAGVVLEAAPEPAALTLPLGACALLLIALTRLGPDVVQAVHPAIHWTWRGLFEFMPARIFYGPSLATYFKPAAVLLGFGATLALGFLSAFRPGLGRAAVAFGLAYGLFYSAEYAYSPFSPNLNRVGAEVARELRRGGCPQPIYLHGYGALACQRSGVAVEPFMYDVPLMPSLTRAMRRTGGTVALLNAPAIGPDTELRRFLASDATLERSFCDKGVALAEIWRVDKP